MKSSRQKLKLLYILKILHEKTDDDHAISTAQLIDELAAYNISAERKSIYDDIDRLRLFGFDICNRASRDRALFLASREFEIPELKLLVDAVQSSKFITRKKSMELISKLEKLTSYENAKKLHRQVFVTNRVKTLNEQIYYNVDKIQTAIAENKQISFKYFDLNLKKEKVYRKDGNLYFETPVALTWDDENYYMITYKAKYDSFTHYRVDKTEGIEITDKERVMPEEEFDLSSYAKSVFGMFGGEETSVSVRFENSLVGVVYDRFGADVPIIPDGDNHFVTKINVAVSPHFLTWIMSFGNRAKIISPDSVVSQIEALAKEIYENYKKG